MIDRLGQLSVYEPSNPDDLRDWTLLDTFKVFSSNVGGPPSRGDETSFKVQFDPNPTPLAYINSVSDERDQLSLVVCALNEVKIFRSVVPSGGGSEGTSIDGIGLGIGGGSGISNTGGASHRLMFFEAVRLPAHPALVRDVSWAGFSVRGTDRIATACKDGAVRVFEVAVTAEGNSMDRNGNGNASRNIGEKQPPNTQSRNTNNAPRIQQSSLTSAITGRTQSQSQSQSQQPTSSTAALSTTTTLPPTTKPTSRSTRTFSFTTRLSSATTLPQAHTDAWHVSFDPQGQVLLSTGSDGVTKFWRKSVLNETWMVFVGQEVTEDDEDEDEDEEEEDEDGEGDEKEGGEERG